MSRRSGCDPKALTSNLPHNTIDFHLDFQIQGLRCQRGRSVVSMSLILSFDPFCYLMILLFRGSSEQQLA